MFLDLMFRLLCCFAQNPPKLLICLCFYLTREKVSSHRARMSRSLTNWLPQKFASQMPAQPPQTWPSQTSDCLCPKSTNFWRKFLIFLTRYEYSRGSNTERIPNAFGFWMVDGVQFSNGVRFLNGFEQNARHFVQILNGQDHAKAELG